MTAINRTDNAAAELDQLRKEFKPRRCEVNGVQYEGAPAPDTGDTCKGCAGYADGALCDDLGACWPALGGPNTLIIWIKVPE